MRKIYLSAILIVFIILSNPLYAKSNLIKSLGGGGGVCLAQGGWEPGFSVIINANMGEAIKYIYFSPYLQYSRAGKSEEVNGKSENLATQYLILGAKMVGFINTKPQGFYLGGAVSYNLISFDDIQWGQLSQSTIIVNNSTTKMGFTGIAGYLFMLRNLSIFIEADYMLTVGGYNNPSLHTGINFNL